MHLDKKKLSIFTIYTFDNMEGHFMVTKRLRELLVIIVLLSFPVVGMASLCGQASAWNFLTVDGVYHVYQCQGATQIYYCTAFSRSVNSNPMSPSSSKNQFQFLVSVINVYTREILLNQYPTEALNYKVAPGHQTATTNYQFTAYLNKIKKVCIIPFN